MHDPFTLVASFFGIDIWHVDPERDGSDDSCDWWGTRRPLNAREEALAKAIYDMEPILDNPPYYPDSPAHLQFREIKKAKWEWIKRSRWRVHPRWHVWHWRINILFLGKLKRWLFVRCASCARRFSWNYSPCSLQWSGGGPLYHHECVPDAGSGLDKHVIRLCPGPGCSFGSEGGVYRVKHGPTCQEAIERN